MTFEQQRLALMVAWVLTVSICGAIVSITSNSGAVALAALALIPPAMAYRLVTVPPQPLAESVNKPRR